MGIEHNFNDRPLLEVIALLSSREESGRLKITGTTRGAFFFRRGKLVDAHMGPFSGFQAVNLAVSVGRVELSFDPSIPSQLSNFHVASERHILKARFGIEAADPKVEESAAILDQQEPVVAKVTRPAELPGEVVTAAAKPEATVSTAARRQPERAQSIPRTVQTISPVDKLEPKLREREIIALVSHWTNSSEARPSLVAQPEPAAGVANPSAAESSQTIPSEEIKPASLEEPHVISRQSPIEIASDASESTTSPSPAKAQPAAEEAVNVPAKSSESPVPTEPAQAASQTIAVVVEINEGHVTEAYVKTPQHGMAAYEATALRLARQRRFPKGTNRRETINLQVTHER
jgi:hypothetical protein